MLKNGIRCGLCNGFNQCAKSNNKYVRDYGKNKESSYFKCWDVDNFCRRVLSQISEKLGFGYFKWVKETSQFYQVVTKP